MASRTSSVVQELNVLAKAGFALPGMQAPVMLYRTPSGKARHGTPDCSRIRTNPTTVTYGLDDLRCHEICHCLYKLPAGPAKDYVDQAELIHAVEQWIANCATAALHDVAAGVELQRRIQQAGPVHELLEDRYETAGQQITGALRTGKAGQVRARSRELLLHRAWRETTAGQDNTQYGHRTYLDPPSGDLGTALYDPNSWGDGRSVLVAGWKVWAQACDADAAPGTAVEHARAAIVKAAGDAPVALNQLPAAVRFDPSGFATPKDWAVAEWVAERDHIAREVTQLWDRTAEQVVAAAPERSNVIRIRTDAVKQAPSATAVRLVVAAFDGVLADGVWYLTVPSLIAEWLGGIDTDNRNAAREPAWLTVYPAGHGDDVQVLRTAVSLLTDDPGQEFGVHLETARLVFDRAA
jgi:hypothetical protein